MPDIKDTAAPIYCKKCGKLVCKTYDSDLEMQLMVNHYEECKKKQEEAIHN